MSYSPTLSRPQTLNGKLLLVCGGSGFIGSNFIRLVLERYKGIKIVNIDKLTYSGNPDNTRDFLKDKRYSFIKGDIRDGKKINVIFQEYQPDYVINFAAETHVDRSIHEGALPFIRTNIEGVSVLLQAAKDNKIKKFVQISTDEVYGSLGISTGGSFTETSPLRPNSPYAASKASADLLCRAFFETHGIPVVVTRCSNNYGPYQSPEKFIPYSLSRLMKSEPIALYGKGNQVRDWIHVDDHSEAVLLVLLLGLPGEIYNIGASNEMPNLLLAQKMISFFGRGREALIFVSDRPGHDARYAVNASKIKKSLGWKPRHIFSQSFPQVLQWYIDNDKWVTRSLFRMGTPNAHISSKKGSIQ